MSTIKISRARSAVFAFLPVSVLLLAVEVALRVRGFRFEPEALQVEYSGNSSARMFRDHLSNRHFTRDPITFWKPMPAEPPFNALGYRGEELPEEKAPGELRILAVGDSNTLGHEASWINEIPGAIDADRLGAERVTAVNAGVYGYTAYQGQHHLKRFLHYRPDVVIISFGGNDASPNILADKDYVPYQSHPIYAWFDHRVALLDLMEHLSLKWASERSGDGAAPVPKEEVNRVSLDDYEKALVEMVGLVREAGATAILATRPMVFNYRADKSSSMRPYFFKTKEVARNLDAGFIDVDAMAAHSWVLFADHSHFNVKGHRFVGAAVASALPRILEGRSREVSAPRYEPRDAYEKARDAAGRFFSRWRPLEANLEMLLQAPGIRGLTTVYESDFASDRHGWSVAQRPRKYKDRKPDAVDGALCFQASPTWFSLAHENLALADRGHHLIWVEAVSRSDLALSIAWHSRGSEFVDDNAVQTLFYGEKTDVPIRLFHVLPAGARAVRVKAHVLRWDGDVCVKRIHISKIDVAE